MSWLGWIVMGLVAGALGKLFAEAAENIDRLVTILIGVAGAFVGGFIGQFLGFGPVDGINFASIATATLGAVVLLFGYRMLRKHS